MTAPEFRQAALGAASPPPGTGAALTALWHDAREEWSLAHELAQRDRSADGSWVHAYLHRREGDLDNAHYWYERAGRPTPKGSLEDEWEEITGTLLDKGGSQPLAPR